MKTIDELNDEVLLHIFEFLSYYELFKASETCSRWNVIITGASKLWKSFNRIWDLYDYEHANPTDLIKQICKKSAQFHGEYWLRDPYNPLIERGNHIYDLEEIRYGWYKSGYQEAGLQLFARFNQKFDIINSNPNKGVLATKNNNADDNDECHEEEKSDDNEEDEDYKKPPRSDMFGFIRTLWRRFNNDHDYNRDDCYDLKSEEDVWKHSSLMDGRTFTQELLGIFDPEWICEYIEVDNQVTVEDILKSLETDGNEDHEQSNAEEGLGKKIDQDVDNTQITSKGDKEESQEEGDTDEGKSQTDITREKLEKCYKPASLSLYKDMVKIMCGPKGDGKVRRFPLSEGCFNENYDLAFYLYLGENAALHQAIFYDL